MRLIASATERREPFTSSARSAAMALMDSRSSEALARSASVLMPGQTLKSWLVRFGCFCSVLFCLGGVVIGGAFCGFLELFGIKGFVFWGIWCWLDHWCCTDLRANTISLALRKRWQLCIGVQDRNR